jgi:hypothetical protein
LRQVSMDHRVKPGGDEDRRCAARTRRRVRASFPAPAGGG